MSKEFLQITDSDIIVSLHLVILFISRAVCIFDSALISKPVMKYMPVNLCYCWVINKVAATSQCYF
jgi:hypothetical protein